MMGYNAEWYAELHQSNKSCCWKHAAFAAPIYDSNLGLAHGAPLIWNITARHS
jgi:hypothetical protein